MVVTLSHQGYIKRSPLSNYRAQRRGGRGKSAARAKDEDFITEAFVASTHAYLLCFTDRGKVYCESASCLFGGWLPGIGRPVINFNPSRKRRKGLRAVLPVRVIPERRRPQLRRHLLSKGRVKKTDLIPMQRPVTVA